MKSAFSLVITSTKQSRRPTHSGAKLNSCHWSEDFEVTVLLDLGFLPKVISHNVVHQ